MSRDQRRDAASPVAGPGRVGAAAALACLLVAFAEVAGKRRLSVVQAASRPRPEYRFRVERQRKRSLDRRIELRLPGADGVELLDLGPLERREVVHLVTKDRAADASAELVTAVIGLVGLEDAARVQRLVAEVLEGRAVNVVGPGLGDHLHDAARRQAELRLVAGVGDLEFLDRVLRQILTRLAVLDPVVDHPVDDVPGAIEGHRSADVDGGEERARSVHGRARHEQRQREVLARVQRQRFDLLLRDRPGNLGPRRVDDRRLAGHRDVLGQGLDLERDVLPQLEADRDGQTNDLVHGKPGELRPQRVATRGQCGEHESPVDFGGQRVRHARRLVAQSQHDSREDARLLVADGAVDSTSTALGRQHRARAKNGDEQPTANAPTHTPLRVAHARPPATECLYHLRPALHLSGRRRVADSRYEWPRPSADQEGLG